MPNPTPPDPTPANKGSTYHQPDRWAIHPFACECRQERPGQPLRPPPQPMTPDDLRQLLAHLVTAQASLEAIRRLVVQALIEAGALDLSAPDPSPPPSPSPINYPNP